jgi:heme/copper-type cytochrome/quinol oxidase subunit 4
MPVIIITAIYIILGDYSFDDNNFIEYFLYPTYYHFVASIIILYIPFYIFMKSDFLKQHILQVMMAIAVVWIVVYCTIYDSSYYHIDTVREPMIRFLYMECMLLGAWFRQNDVLFRNKFKVLYPIATFVMFLIYFASKIAFSKIERISEFQFLNQVALFVLLVCVMIMFSSLDSRLENIPRVVKEIITFLSNMTLEIYVVQYVLIEKLRSIVFFPLNWIILTTTILISAFILNQLCKFIYSRIDMLSRIIGGGK